MAGKPIDEILKKLDDHFKDPQEERLITLTVEKLVRKARLDAVSEFSKGYCMKFSIPLNDVSSILDSINTFGREDVKQAFLRQWQIPGETFMYSDIYYHNLLLLMTHGLRTKNKSLVDSSFILMMLKLWNGRLMSSIKFCDPDVMSYVVTNMMNKKNICNKFHNPFEMITNYFVPYLLNTYSERILRDTTELKILFSQSYNRLRQVFRSDSIPDKETGEPRYRSGLQPLYFKAVESGFKFSTMGSRNHSDEESSAGDVLSSSGLDEQIENVVNYIVMNINPNYDRKFLEFVNNESTIKLVHIDKIIKAIHNHNYIDQIRDIVELIFSRLSDIPKAKFCSPDFISDIIKRKIISSKHTSEITALKTNIDQLLNMILNSVFDKQYDYDTYSNTQKAQWRRIIVYAVGYNIQRQICFS
jgi:hypothetical protein